MEQRLQDRIMVIASAASVGAMPFREAGFCVQTPCKGHNLFHKLVRAAFLRLNLPFQRLWYNLEFLDRSWDLIILFEGVLTTPGYLKWLCKRCPNTKILLLYPNPVNQSLHPGKIPSKQVIPWTFDPGDAEKYGIHHYESIYIPGNPIPKSEIQYDAFFVGKDKNRAAALRQLEAQMLEMGLTPCIHIVPDNPLKKKEGYQEPMPYEQTRKMMGASRAVIDYLQAGQTGISVRTVESIFNGIKVITNVPGAANYSFYDKRNIFILGKDSLETLPEFLHTPFVPVKQEILDAMLLDHVLEDILCE